MSELTLIIGGFGVIQSLFMSLFILLRKKKNTINYLLSFLFILLTLRIGKSMFWLYGESASEVVLNIGFVAHMATAQTLFLYTYLVLKKEQFKKIQLLHYLPAFVLLFLVTQLTLNGFWYRGGYTFLLLHQMVYVVSTLVLLILSIKQYIKTDKDISKKQKLWLIILFVGVSSIQIVYFANYVLGVINYAVAPNIYAFFIFIIALFGVINHKVFDLKTKYSNINLTDTEFNIYKVKIEKYIQNEQPYLDNSMSLNKLASAMKINSYLVSHIINRGFNLSVTDYLNSLRIEEVKNKLLDSNYRNIKISEIAYECGFSTLSVFNASFKKHVGMTPTTFRRKSSKL